MRLNSVILDLKPCIHVKISYLNAMKPLSQERQIEYRSDDVTKNFLDISVLDTMYRWSTMKNIHSPNWVGIGSWGPKIWPHEYLISPIEISVNWSGSKQL